MATRRRANLPTRDLRAHLRLVAVTPDGMPAVELVARSVAAATGGATAVWLRDRQRHPRALLDLARQLRARLPASTWLIVSDHSDIARASGANAVQLGSRSLAPLEVRSVVPATLFVGYSAHVPVDEAERAAIDASDYVIIGPVFATPKPAAAPAPIGVERLASAARSIRQPVLAVGGINPRNCGRLRQAPIAGVAVIRAIYRAADSASASASLRAALDP